MTVNKDDVKKALEALQAVGAEDLTKGHANGDRVNIETDSMVSQSTDNQVHHTSSNSEPASWAGSVGRDCPSNGAEDAIDGNGTDYNGGAAGFAKAIAIKLAKGEAFNEIEQAFVDAGGLSKGGFPFDKKDDDKKDDDAEKAVDEDEKDMNKSFNDLASENEDMQKGFEVSDYLSAQANVLNKSLDCMEARIVDRVAGMIGSLSASSEEFNVGMSKALVRMAESQVAQGQRIDHVEQTPARGPKSTQGAQVVEKSFGGPETAQATQPDPQVIQSALESLMMKGQVKGLDVIKHESTGEISPQNMQLVKSLVSGAGQ